MSKIILIGGPPRSGKTTLAQRIAKAEGMSWISTDVLDDISKAYVPEIEWDMRFPKTVLRKKSGGDNDALYEANSSRDVVAAYLKQAESVHPAIEAFVACALKEGWDYVIEGYHITPTFLSKFKSAGYQFSSVVLVNTNAAGVVERSLASNIKSDWLRDNTKREETLQHIVDMVSMFSQELDQEAKKLGMDTVDTSHDFQKQLDQVFEYLRE